MPNPGYGMLAAHRQAWLGIKYLHAPEHECKETYIGYTIDSGGCVTLVFFQVGSGALY